VDSRVRAVLHLLVHALGPVALVVLLAGCGGTADGAMQLPSDDSVPMLTTDAPEQACGATARPAAEIGLETSVVLRPPDPFGTVTGSARITNTSDRPVEIRQHGDLVASLVVGDQVATTPAAGSPVVRARLLRPGQSADLPLVVGLLPCPGTSLGVEPPDPDDARAMVASVQEDDGLVVYVSEPATWDTTRNRRPLHRGAAGGCRSIWCGASRR
jgi:hypothetical protein